MTRTELLAATARDLHILAENQTLTAGRQAKLLEKYIALHADLLKIGATWAVAEDIPSNCEEPVIAMLCARSARGFGVGVDRRRELIELGALHAAIPSLAERQLRKALDVSYVSKPLRGTYF